MYMYKIVFEARGGTYFKNPDKAHKDGQGAGRGYMHMIRLYSGMLFQHPIFHAFDNYMRLDTDSFFVGETEVFWLHQGEAFSDSGAGSRLQEVNFRV